MPNETAGMTPRTSKRGTKTLLKLEFFSRVVLFFRILAVYYTKMKEEPHGSILSASIVQQEVQSLAQICASFLNYNTNRIIRYSK